LWNVLLGQMQFVGPRPELASFVDGQDPLWVSLLAGKPGLTDLATLVYRNEEEGLARHRDPVAAYRNEILPKKLALGMAYRRIRNLRSDLKLLWLTARYSFFPGGFQADTIRQAFVETE